MKLQIFGQTDKEKVIALKMDQLSPAINITAVDEHGKMILKGNLVTFLPNGTLQLHRNVAEELGFKLDDEGAIKVVYF